MASIAGVISHVPAGLGVFEAVLLIALPEAAHAPGVAAALVIYRLIYYVLPLLLAAVVFALHQAYVAGGVVVERLDLARRGTQLILPIAAGDAGVHRRRRAAHLRCHAGNVHIGWTGWAHWRRWR